MKYEKRNMKYEIISFYLKSRNYIRSRKNKKKYKKKLTHPKKYDSN